MFGEDFLFCCLEEEEKKKVKNAIENSDFRTVYELQSWLVPKPKFFQCTRCGRKYPRIRIDYKGQMHMPEEYKNFPGTTKKYRKRADVFWGDHYYAQNKKELWKINMNEKDVWTLENEISIMGETMYLAISKDETYVATESQKGTLQIQNLLTGAVMAQKRKCKTTGSFLFLEEEEALLYFYENRLWRWKFLQDSTEALVDFSKLYPEKEEGNIVCQTMLYHSNHKKYIFRLWNDGSTVLAESDLTEVKKIKEITGSSGSSKLLYHSENNMYTIAMEDKAIFLDEDFREIESIICPEIVTYSNGGGYFPMECHRNNTPERIYISPQGKWLLLDYFSNIILLRRSDCRIMYFLYHYNGRTSTNMGFVDEDTIWYNWGDSTYVHRIDSEENDQK